MIRIAKRAANLEAAVSGLTGTVDSIGYRLNELDRHIHNWTRVAGLAAVPNGETHRADFDSMTPFTLDAGNDQWSDPWVQIIGSDDTPTDLPFTAAKFDLSFIVLDEVERDKELTRLQIAFGATAAGALSAGTYSERILKPQNATKNMPFRFMTRRQDAGEKAWARVWVDGQDTGTFAFFWEAHYYVA